MPKRPTNRTPRKNKGRWQDSVKAKRREVAEARQKEYDKLTTKEKIAKLDFGNFVAIKQRSKLEKKLINGK